MKAFLNCKTCSTAGWSEVTPEQQVFCRICKSEYPITAGEISAIEK